MHKESGWSCSVWMQVCVQAVIQCTKRAVLIQLMQSKGKIWFWKRMLSPSLQPKLPLSSIWSPFLSTPPLTIGTPTLIYNDNYHLFFMLLFNISTFLCQFFSFLVVSMHFCCQLAAESTSDRLLSMAKQTFKCIWSTAD